MKTDLSIIIVNFQTKDFLSECLSSLKKSNMFGVEVIVVDNNSGDDSVEMVRRDFPEVKLICLDNNLGFGRANNIGVKNSQGEFILFLNSDTEMEPKVVQGMLRNMKLNEKIGVLGCRLIDSLGNLQLSFGKFPTFKRELIRKFIHNRLSLNDYRIREYVEAKYSGEVPIDWISGACMMVRRKALDAAGAFDPEFFMYFEDIDLSYRIKQAGWDVCYNSDLHILHHGGITAKRNLARSYLEHRKSQFHFCRKYYGLMGLTALKIFVFMKFLVTAVWSILYFSLNILKKEKRHKEYERLLLCKKMMEMSIRGTVNLN